jgi:hypothetical protein
MIKAEIAVGAAIAAGAAYLLYKGWSNIGALDPTNPDNIVNRGVTDVYQNLTGSTGTIGADLYDGLHPDAAAGTNAVNGGVTTIYQKVTGSKSSIGSDIYDWLNP